MGTLMKQKMIIFMELNFIQKALISMSFHYGL